MILLPSPCIPYLDKIISIHYSLYLHKYCMLWYKFSTNKTICDISKYTGVAYGNGGIVRVARCLDTEFTQSSWKLLWDVLPRKKNGPLRLPVLKPDKMYQVNHWKSCHC